MSNKNIKMLIGLVILAVFIPLIIASTYSVSGTGDTTFDVPEGEQIISNSIVINNPAFGCDVRLNNRNQGACSINSLDNNDFEDQFGNWEGGARGCHCFPWEGSNQITFTEDIDDFTLTYTTGPVSAGDGTNCNADSHCPSGKCLFEECCEHDTDADPPIDFTSPITSSCPDSSIPIATILNCGNRNDNNYKNIDLFFYLGNTRLTPNNANSGEECTVEGGVTGWDLVGEIRCGANVDVGTGTYVLKAKYTIDGESYEVIIDNNFQITVSCNSNTICSHAGGASINADGTVSWISAPYYNPPSVIAGGLGEITNDATDGWVVKPGSIIEVNGISSINAQCSNGVPYNIKQGFVTWSSLGIFDSLVTCDISGMGRIDLIGDSPSITITGYKPPVCNLALTQTQSNTVRLGNFVNPGNYDVKMDMVNAICDSPDYICPDLTSANPNRASLCKIGSMGNPWQRADGWVPLENYTFKVINSNISYVETLRFQIEDVLTVNYNITNTGNGRIKIINSSIPALTDFEVSCSNCPLGGINEGQTRQMTVNIESKNVKSNNIINSPVPFNYTIITLKDYTQVSNNNSNVILNYSAPILVRYDDDYGLSTYGSFAESNNINFNMNFECNASEEKYALNLTDRIFYCTCEGKGFCEDLKVGDDKPCACISNPKKGEVINGTDVLFNASRSFDDITNPNNLMFKWAYTGTNQTIYENNGTSGAFFLKHFAAPGQYFVSLEVNDSNKVGKDYTDFVLVFSINQPYCLKTQLIWVEPDGSLVPSLTDCYRSDGNNTQYCCPPGSECINLAGTWECNVTAEMSNVSRCSDYDNSADCLADSYSVGQMSVNEKLNSSFLLCDREHIINNSCTEFISNCKCNWKNDACIASWNYDLYCDGINDQSGTCDFIVSWVTDSCELQGVMEVIWEAVWNGNPPKPADCEGGQRFVPCRRIMGLNFVSIYSLLIVAVIIILIYCYEVWKKKK